MAFDNDNQEVNSSLLQELDELDAIPGDDINEDNDEYDENSSSENEDEENEEDASEEEEETEADGDSNEESEESEETDIQEERDSDDEDTIEDDDSESADEVSELRKLLNQANEKILQLEGKSTQQKQEPEPKQEEQNQTQEIPKIDLFDKDFDFFQGKDPEDVVENKSEFNSLLLDFANKVSQKAMQQTMLSIPAIVKHHAEESIVIKRTVDKFYEENADLIDFKATVGSVANQVHSEHTDWDLGQVMNEAAVRTRKALKLATKMKQKEHKKSDNLNTVPKNAKSKTNARKQKNVKSKKTKLQRELDEL